MLKAMGGIIGKRRSNKDRFKAWFGMRQVLCCGIMHVGRDQAYRSGIDCGSLGTPLAGPETLHPRDDALLYIAYVMLIWTAPIPGNRWRCSLWP